MTTGLFAPKGPDGKSEWRVVYELVRELRIGDVITFETLCGALHRDPEGDLAPVYRAVGRAVKELRRNDHRSMASVPGIGYRMLHPSEHSIQARRYGDRSRRQMRTGVEVIRAADTSQLTPYDKQRLVAQGMAMQAAFQAIEMLGARQRKTEAVLATQDGRMEHAERKVSRMAQAMHAAGILTDDDLAAMVDPAAPAPVEVAAPLDPVEATP